MSKMGESDLTLVRTKSGREIALGGEALRQALANGAEAVCVTAQAGAPVEGGLVDYGYGPVPALPRGETRTPQQIIADEDMALAAHGLKPISQQLAEAGRDLASFIEATGDKYRNALK